MTNFVSIVPKEAVALALLDKPQTPANMLIAIEGLRCHLDNHYVTIQGQYDAIMRQLENMEVKLRGILKEVHPVWSV